MSDRGDSVAEERLVPGESATESLPRQSCEQCRQSRRLRILDVHSPVSPRLPCRTTRCRCCRWCSTTSPRAAPGACAGRRPVLRPAGRHARGTLRPVRFPRRTVRRARRGPDVDRRRLAAGPAGRRSAGRAGGRPLGAIPVARLGHDADRGDRPGRQAGRASPGARSASGADRSGRRHLAPAGGVSVSLPQRVHLPDRPRRVRSPGISTP